MHRSVTVLENNSNRKPRTNTGEQYITLVPKGKYKGKFRFVVPVKRSQKERGSKKQAHKDTFGEALRFKRDIVRRQDRGKFGPWP